MSWLRYKIRDDIAVGIFSNGEEMLFDICDLEQVSSRPWFIDAEGYPSTAVNKQRVRLHRFLLDDVPNGMVVDHINRNKLDNRRCNMRVCTYSENAANGRIRVNNTSGVHGVFWDKRVERWRAQICRNKKTKDLGVYDSFADAVAARKKAEREHNERSGSHL